MQIESKEKSPCGRAERPRLTGGLLEITRASLRWDHLWLALTQGHLYWESPGRLSGELFVWKSLSQAFPGPFPVHPGSLLRAPFSELPTLPSCPNHALTHLPLPAFSARTLASCSVLFFYPLAVMYVPSCPEYKLCDCRGHCQVLRTSVLRLF